MPDNSHPEPLRYQGAMISSTFNDLQQHRHTLIDALQKQKLFPVVMEGYTVNPDDDLISSSLNMVGEASAYIGIISHRCGQVPKDAKRNPKSYSISRLEFEEAQRLGRPTVVFVMGDKHPLTKEDFETDPKKLKKLSEYRERAKKGRIYVVFENLEDFVPKAVHAAATLRRYLDEQRNLQTKSNQQTDPTPSLLDEICSLEEGQLVAAILDRSWTLKDVLDAIAGRPDRALKIVRDITAQHSEVWHRLLAAFVASHVEIPPEELISLGFEANIQWGKRGAILSLLRFTPESKKRAARSLVSGAAKGGALVEMDTQRLAILGLGHLDGHHEISSMLHDYAALDNEYYNQKLGSHSLLAFLQCYLQANNDLTERDALGDFTRIAEATERLGNASLSVFDYADELQCLRPGEAVQLFRHLRDHGHEIPLQAVLANLGHRPNPLIWSELISLGKTSSNPTTAAGALHAAAYTGSAQAEAELVGCAANGLPGARAALFLANGVRRNLDAKATIEATLADPGIPHDGAWLNDVRGNALWAAGELGREDRAFALRVFDSPRHDPDDAYERGLALLGLAKAKCVLSEEEIDTAMEIATTFFERAQVGIAGALAGWPHGLKLGLQGMIHNAGPPYRLIAHIARDLKITLREHAGEGGKALVTLLELGDFT